MHLHWFLATSVSAVRHDDVDGRRARRALPSFPRKAGSIARRARDAPPEKQVLAQ
jgi:hypothetical protein